MDIIFCIECGYKLPGTAKFCKKCGVAISLSEVDLDNAYKSIPSPWIEKKFVDDLTKAGISDRGILDIKKKFRARRAARIASIRGSSGSRFDKFSEKARRVISNSKLEAQRLKQNYIGTEHIVLGIIIETTSTANQILSNIGIGLDNLKTDIETSLKPN